MVTAPLTLTGKFTGQGQLRVALVQYCAGKTPQLNLQFAKIMVRQAAARGAELIQLPEVANLCNRNVEEAKFSWRYEDEDEFLAAIRSLAKDLGVWIHVGSLALRNDHPPSAENPSQAPAVNRGFLINQHGEIVARYDKIHMFDVSLAKGERYQESQTFAPGHRLVVAPTNWGEMGLTICYDVRFPQLYRSLAMKGAGIMLIPAAFTHTTGKAHWHVLMRARAIETGSFVLAAAQGGHHEDGRHTYGHSLIIDPWGVILAEADGNQPVLIEATLMLDKVNEVRSMIPSLSTSRNYH